VAQITRRVYPLNPADVPSVDADAVQMYTNAGGVVTSECSFGIDPLANDDALIRRRDTEFKRNNPSFHEIFQNAVNGDGSLMETGSCHQTPREIYRHEFDSKPRSTRSYPICEET